MKAIESDKTKHLFIVPGDMHFKPGAVFHGDLILAVVPHPASKSTWGTVVTILSKDGEILNIKGLDLFAGDYSVLRETCP